MKKRRANPKKAVAAAMPLPIGDVRPMTLAMWAALEHIDSPLLKSSSPDGQAVLDLLPSLYLLTHDPREIFRANLLDLAMEWADKLPVTAIADIRRAAEAQIRTVAAVIPEDDEDAPRKKKSDGPIAHLLHYACSTFGWSYREAFYETPLSVIALLHRNAALEANKIFPLQVIEEIDDGD